MKILILNLSTDKIMKNDILKGAQSFAKERFDVVRSTIFAAGLVELKQR